MSEGGVQQIPEHKPPPQPQMNPSKRELLLEGDKLVQFQEKIETKKFVKGKE